jgi:exonuclease VII small subunit
MSWITDLNSFRDFIGYAVLCAPDDFPEEDYLQPDEQMNLERAFEELRNALNLVKPSKLNDAKRRDALSLLEESLNSYRSGNDIKGAHLLQDFQNVIFNDDCVREDEID